MFEKNLQTERHLLIRKFIIVGFYVDDDLSSISSNFHPLSGSITHNTNKKHVQSIISPQERENLIKLGLVMLKKNRDHPWSLINDFGVSYIF